MHSVRRAASRVATTTSRPLSPKPSPRSPAHPLAERALVAPAQDGARPRAARDHRPRAARSHRRKAARGHRRKAARLPLSDNRDSPPVAKGRPPQAVRGEALRPAARDPPHKVVHRDAGAHPRKAGKDRREKDLQRPAREPLPKVRSTPKKPASGPPRGHPALATRPRFSKENSCLREPAPLPRNREFPPHGTSKRKSGSGVTRSPQCRSETSRR